MTRLSPVRLLAHLLIVLVVAAGLVPQAPHAALAHLSAAAAPQAALARPPAPEVLQAPASPAALASPSVPEWLVRELPNGTHYTESVAVGDVNGDGVLDIVQGNGGTASEVLLGQGDGTFWPSIKLPGGSRYTKSVALGDLNSDGVLDIVLGNSGVDSEVLLGQGNGTFSPSITLSNGADDTESVALGDLNSDGLIDIVLGNFGSASEVLLGKGDGTFSKSKDLPNGTRTTKSVAIGDLNGDGILDIVQGNAYQSSEVLLGENDGGFLQSITLPSAFGVALGDVNDDSALDIVVIQVGVASKVILGNGDGTVSKSIELSDIARSHKDVAMGDINGDGVLDIVLGTYGGASELLLGRGDGTFAESIQLPSNALTTETVCLGDLNGDGLLDIVLGNLDIATQVLLGRGNATFLQSGILTDGPHDTSSLALGDLNGDGVLDIVQGNLNGSTMVLLGRGDGTFSRSVPLPNGDRNTRSVDLGDLNGDGVLDIVQGNQTVPNEVLLGRGDGRFSQGAALPNGSHDTRSIVLGDLNRDNVLDIIQGNFDAVSEVLLGRGDGTFLSSIALPNGKQYTESVVVGDLDRDGILDIVQGNVGGFSEVLLGQGDGTFVQGVMLPKAWSVALGDLNKDGALDIVLGKEADVSEVLLGRGDGTFLPGNLLPVSVRSTRSVKVGDLNRDGVLDIVRLNHAAANEVLLGQGDGTFLQSVSLPNGTLTSWSMALGDLNQDGVLDIVRGNFSAASEVLLGQRNPHFIRRPSTDLDPPMCSLTSGTITWSQGLPSVHVSPPVGVPGIPLASNLQIHFSPTISIPYTLRSPEVNQVRRVLGFYSLDDGGTWQPATPTSTTQTCGVEAMPAGRTHMFVWDVAADGITGRYDQVRFRIEAVPSMQHARGQAVELPRFASSSGVSSPFRVRGTQVRVVDKGAHGVEGVLVYRLPGGQVRDGQLTPPQTLGNPQWFTDWRGYLKGHDVLTPTDRLVALAPISATDTYTLYSTSAQPTPQGLDLYQVRSSGVQTLTVRPEQPLILFNLDVSLEWDARSDVVFRNQLAANLKRASELLFRWSGGQAALGDLRVFNNGERWNDAHIRIYATNRLRPNAAQGGIVSRPKLDPLSPELSYAPGQVRIGAVWDRYGDSGANLGEDWARTLAHELGHYALFLNDNYLGKDAQGRLIGVTGCPSPMADPYRDDYGMFHPGDDGWNSKCANTLSQIENKRSDWDTIKTFYAALNKPAVFDPKTTPALLPLAVTQVQFAPAFADSASPPLSAPIVLLTDANGDLLQPSRQARAVLYQSDRLIDLGAPTGDQLLARGARPGDQVCVYDFAQMTRVGCARIDANYQPLRLELVEGWRPDIQITGVTSQSLQVQVETEPLPSGEQLQVQFYPSDQRKLGAIKLDLAKLEAARAIYTGTIVAPKGASGTLLEGFLRVWEGTGYGGREVLVDLRVGANGAKPWITGVPRSFPAKPWITGAPVLSADGQAILYTSALTLTEGQFYTLQATDSPPPPPSWATPVGRAYRLNSSKDLKWAGSSVNFSYLSRDVLAAQEDGIRVFVWEERAGIWRALDTALDTVHNQASARVDGPGLFMLMTSAQVPLSTSGWNLVYFYPGVQQAVTEAAQTIAGEFTSIYGYSSKEADAAEPWKIYDRLVPQEWANVVNDLENLTYGEGYWIYATRPVAWFVRSGAGAPSTQARSLRPPPATYYGLAPSVGLTVEAQINGTICGSTATTSASVGGVLRPVFVVKVRAAGDGSSNCGLPGSPITLIFREGTREVQRILTAWENSQAHQLAPRAIYLPLVRR